MSRAYLLHTSAFLKAAINDGKGLGQEALRTILSASNSCLLSVVSIAELGILVSVGRLKMSAETLRQLLEDLDIQLLPYQANHAFRYFSLPPAETPRDPQDRMIIATALEEQIPIITSDVEFSKYAGLKVIWRRPYWPSPVPAFATWPFTALSGSAQANNTPPLPVTTYWRPSSS